MSRDKGTASEKEKDGTAGGKFFTRRLAEQERVVKLQRVNFLSSAFSENKKGFGLQASG